MTTTTENKFCIEGRFWTTVPARQHTAEELEILRELLQLEAEETTEEGEG